MFKQLSVRGWRQFRQIDIDFHPRLTLLTGANGAGKTTLLSLVTRHFGWGSLFVSTPTRNSSVSSLQYAADLWDFGGGSWLEKHGPPRPLSIQRDHGSQQAVGTIHYQSGPVASLMIPTQVGSTYDINISGQQSVEGMHIPSHRSTYAYQAVQNIPTVPRRRADVFNQYSSLIRSRYSGGHTTYSPQYYMKETLIALATFGYGNQAVQADPESAKVFEDFQTVLRRMLPPSIGFRALSIRVPEIILETESGDFSIDSISGGIAAVIDLAWQIFMFQPSNSRFVVTIDEPENHLHPELQRRVLFDLVNAFPNVQFVVATHSPFIVGSVPDSAVYVLAYDNERRVESHLLDTANKAGTANEILREVLGLETTIPVWVESELDNIVNRYALLSFDEVTISALRVELATLGLSARVPAAIAQIAAKKDTK
jgi:predicted ATPase